MNRSIKPVPNLFTYETLMIRLAVKEMQSAKFYAILLASVMLVGIFSLSPAFSTLMSEVIIRTNGRIGELATVTANSGSAEDIQAAVDQVAAMGGGNVYIPEGTFNFVPVGGPWQKVTVPAGVNIFGAPTDRDANDDVIPPWKTILVMPYEAPNEIEWFEFNGIGVSGEPSRFSDIKLVGYREIDPDSPYPEYWGIDMNDVIDFRIDHCYFRQITGGLSIDSSDNGNCCGVIDHNRLINDPADGVPYGSRTVTYGVSVEGGYGTTRWEPTDQVVGQYTGYTTFIEDNYFQGWRHCVASNDGVHYVFRYNKIQYDYASGSIDAHGSYSPERVGSRAWEIYENEVVDADPEGIWFIACMLRGGAGTIFNNIVDDSYLTFIQFQREGSVEKCWIKDVYIWDNTVDCGTFLDDADFIEGVDYFLYAMPGYEPYPYPHPLTLEATP